MLGKLIKHDFKALSRYLLPLHAAVLLLSLIGRFFVTETANWSDPSPLLFIYSIGYYFILITVSIGTSILIAVYFYRDLFSKHGYLSWTIPASPAEHLASKTLTGLIWILFNFIVVLGSIILFIYIPDIPWDKVAEFFVQELGISLGSFLGTIVLIGFIGCFCGVMTYYVAIALGQLFSSHRVLGAVVVYCGISFLIQIFSTVALISMPSTYMTAVFDASAWGTQFIRIIWIAGIASLIEGIVFYVITYFIMNKKLNLN